MLIGNLDGTRQIPLWTDIATEELIRTIELEQLLRKYI